MACNIGSALTTDYRTRIAPVQGACRLPKSGEEGNYFACPEDSFGVANRVHFTASTPEFRIRKAHATLDFYS